MNVSLILRFPLIVIVILLSCTGIYAQELKFVSFKPLPKDNTAQIKPCYDASGKKLLPLVKLKVGKLKGLLFPKADHKKFYYDENEGYYGVYVTNKKTLAYLHEEFSGTIQWNTIEGFNELEPGKTYLLEMEAPASTSNTMIVLKVSYPVNAIVMFDGKSLPQSPKGIYEIPVQPNTYSYSIQSENFMPTKGSVSVEKGETKTISKRLQPITHWVNVECNEKDAQVYVDHNYYGVVGKLRLPQGKHNIRVQKKGYIDVEKNVIITAQTGSLSYHLKENRNVKEKHPTEVTIYSTGGSKNMYMNEAKIKGWTNGAVVKMWPGKYLISDDYHNEKEITVEENKPITIRL